MTSSSIREANREVNKIEKPVSPKPPNMKYKLPDEASFEDKTVYHACYHIQMRLLHGCKNNCDKCLYRNSFKVCIRDIAVEIMKNIERKYGVDEESRIND